LNACAKALSEFFRIQRSGDQIANHLKTWRKKYTKINQLRKISGAIWDEDHFIISLDHDNYTSYMEVTLYTSSKLYFFIVNIFTPCSVKLKLHIVVKHILIEE
jgi:methionine salvage enolase-phosphatase E1